MRTLGGWILDQVLEAIGIIAEAKRRRVSPLGWWGFGVCPGRAVRDWHSALLDQLAELVTAKSAQRRRTSTNRLTFNPTR